MHKIQDWTNLGPHLLFGTRFRRQIYFSLETLQVASHPMFLEHQTQFKEPLLKFESIRQIQTVRLPLVIFSNLPVRGWLHINQILFRVSTSDLVVKFCSADTLFRSIARAFELAQRLSRQQILDVAYTLGAWLIDDPPSYPSLRTLKYLHIRTRISLVLSSQQNDHTRKCSY